MRSHPPVSGETAGGRAVTRPIGLKICDKLGPYGSLNIKILYSGGGHNFGVIQPQKQPKTDWNPYNRLPLGKRRPPRQRGTGWWLFRAGTRLQTPADTWEPTPTQADGFGASSQPDKLSGFFRKNPEIAFPKLLCKSVSSKGFIKKFVINHQKQSHTLRKNSQKIIFRRNSPRSSTIPPCSQPPKSPNP